MLFRVQNSSHTGIDIKIMYFYENLRCTKIAIFVDTLQHGSLTIIFDLSKEITGENTNEK